MAGRAKSVPRVYADTSVFGGTYDKEFAHPSRRFFEMCEMGLFDLVTSDVVRREIANAPGEVRKLFESAAAQAEVAFITDEVLALRDSYVSASILSSKWLDDALHAALATVSGCSLIVSWNFKHIVHFDKIPLYSSCCGPHNS